MHVESSKLSPAELARVLLARGTTTIVCDPHELANVLGPEGVHWFLDACDGLPLDVLVVRPVGVPASPFESPRAPLSLAGRGGHPGPRSRARARRDDELTRPSSPGRPRSWRRSSWPGASASTVMRRAWQAVARRLPGHRHQHRPRGDDARRGAGEAAARRVGAAARGLERPQPARPAAARARVRARALRVLHRRPRARLPAARGPHRPDVPRRGRARASRPRMRCCSRRCTRRCVTACRGWARSRRATAPTASCSTTSARSGRRSCSRTAASSRETASPRRSTPAPRRTGCATACASRRLPPDAFRLPHDGERVRAIGLIRDQILHRSPRADAERAGRPGRRRPRARPREDRGRRAPPRHRPHRPRASSGASACGAAPSPRPWRTTRTTSSRSAWTTTTSGALRRAPGRDRWRDRDLRGRRVARRAARCRSPA